MDIKSRGVQTREAILKVSAQSFTIHGYRDTSLSDILSAVAISKGAFYHHFKSKEEMALAVLDEVRDDFASIFEEATANLASSDEHLRAVLRKLADLHNGGQWTKGVLLARLVQETSAEEGLLADRVREVVAWLLGVLDSLVKAAQDGGKVRNDLPSDAAASLILSTWFGAAGLNGLQHEAFSLEVVFGAIMALLNIDG